MLLVCPEPLGHRHPAGIGIRFLEMARVLLADGHTVNVLSLDGGTVPGCSSAKTSPETLTRGTEDSDVAVVQGHVANDLFIHGRPIPTAVDLYDPFIIENLHYYASRGAEVFTHDHGTLVRSLLRGDLFLCASDSQRMFYLGLMLAVGRLNPILFEADPHLSSLIQLAPYGVQPPGPRTTHPPAHDILFGGIYDWYDPVLAIDAVALLRRRIPDARLTFSTQPNPSLTPQGKAAEAITYVRDKAYEDFIRFEPWIPYEERGPFFQRFSAALLTFPQSLETDLAMRTRIYDYLWGGLPVVTSSAPGTDALLRRYNAGIVLANGGSAEDFAAVLEEVIQNREPFVEGAHRFVAENQWERVLQPLVEFCRSPRFEKTKETFATPLEVPDRPASILDRLRRRIAGAS